MPPDSSAGYWWQASTRQTDQGELQAGQLIEQRLGQREALTQRRLDVLADRERAEQGAVLEQHTLARRSASRCCIAEPSDVVTQHLDARRAPARSRPRIVRSRTDLPAPDPPTTPSTSPATHLEVEVVMDDLRPEAGAQPARRG